MSDGMGRELAYLSSHATNRYFIPNWGKLLQIDFSSIQNDEANSAKLLEKGVDILKAEDKVALAEKLYFKKIAKQLGFSAEDIEEAMN